MHANEYQQLASRTLIDAPESIIADNDLMIIWNAIGLAGESGEVCELVKKGIFHRHGLDREKAIKEIGDVLWYTAALCTKLGITLEEAMERNIKKLQERYPDGYSSEASQQRVDVIPPGKLAFCRYCDAPIEFDGVQWQHLNQHRFTVCIAEPRR